METIKEKFEKFDDGSWSKSTYDLNGNQMTFENSDDGYREKST